MQPFIVGIRFNPIGKIYHFDSKSLTDLKVGEHVIVETSRGKHLGEVMQLLEEPPKPPDGGWKPVQRRATPRDLLLRETWRAKQTEAMIECRARAAELKLNGVKIVAAGFLYSFFWCASTAIYFLLRRDVDATEMDEVFQEDQDEETYGLPAVEQDDAGAPVIKSDELTSNTGESEESEPESEEGPAGPEESGEEPDQETSR